jgi:signal transduction histidine kinase
MRMGRLFWKFFFFFWLAQLVTSIGVGVAMWLLRPEHAPPGMRPPPPGLHIDAAGNMPREHYPPPPGLPPHYKPSLLPPLMPILAGSAVSLLFAALLALYFARPIRRLKLAFDDAASGNLEARIGTSMQRRKDELTDLGSDFDRMAERLQGLVDGQRRLLHDVSHELRSPLARMQAAADLLRQQPHRTAEFASRIERDTERMNQLVGELLTLARLDAGTAGAMDETVDLHDLIASIVDDAEFEASPRQCHIAATIQEALTLTGNLELLHRAIENVVRNALRHSPDRGRIEITATRRAGLIEIEVTDQGNGVPEAELDTIFEPFFRSAGADTFAGYGLGLAITRRIVEAHGGGVTARNCPDGGLRVSLRLPISSA